LFAVRIGTLSFGLSPQGRTFAEHRLCYRPLIVQPVKKADAFEALSQSQILSARGVIALKPLNVSRSTLPITGRSEKFTKVRLF